MSLKQKGTCRNPGQFRTHASFPGGFEPGTLDLKSNALPAELFRLVVRDKSPEKGDTTALRAGQPHD